MTRGKGPTSNKYRKYLGTECLILEMGNAPHQYTVERLVKDPPEDWTSEEIDEILSDSGYEMPKEVKDAPAPDAKRGPGRPRKVSVETDTAGEVSPTGAE